MTLNSLWFALIVILFTGFFVLEGFDFGVGILAPIVGKSDEERRLLYNSIGPFWDGNEVWLIAAGGAMFAAFPQWYATLFSGFYIPLFLLVIALIARGVGLEYRSKLPAQHWRKAWDTAIFLGSVLPPIIWGIALANIMKGVPIDAQMNDVGSLWGLVNLYSVVCAIALMLLFATHGALFLTLKTTGEIQTRARKAARRTGLWTTIFMLIFVILSYFYSSIFSKTGIDPGTIAVLAGISLISVPFFIRAKKDGWAFLMTSFTIVFSTITVFIDLFPRVMVSSLNPNWSLTIYNAASNPYSLRVMTWIALTLLPIILGYTIWTFWTFRRRLSLQDHMEY
ncbi:cytochrome d ubiquinol oxidase subunit II [Alicyclobacillus acidoterrestris]|uniref:cytochrome d ubiquinol oxidase subunit II n=1 Tax=Alicyclobacillus TaxID=29330 RepID=UPI001A8F702A|nr:cytochrome d ubiquinol oxidase subunit II [Alicyclobacillus suci]